MQDKIFDVAIIGGGLAGLALAIQAKRAGYSTILFEKERYPFHRVCGEYISLESWNFLQDLGVPLSDLQLPQIRELLVSAPNGTYVRHSLPLGGFGISRYFLDNYLFTLAKDEGVMVLEDTKVSDIQFRSQQFEVSTGNRTFPARITAGTFGKRSNLDVKWKRPFTQKKDYKLNSYIAVKYHISYPIPEQEIALHNFDQGYCGISQVEENKQCLCYLTTAGNLSKSNYDIRTMETSILMKNPFLRDIFSTARFLCGEPLTISQVAFDSKSQVEQHVLLLGDAAGMITPLCGNGMSMALHSSKLAFTEIHSFLNGKIDRYEMEIEYTRKWEHFFATRMRNGKMIQSMFGNSFLTNILVTAMKPFPGLMNFLIRQTHGQPF